MMKRIAYFDNVKGILILFIILAHVISLCATYYSYDNKILKLNCMFMLQCFFFISGYFASKSKTKKSKKIIKQINIYLLWDILITIYYSLILHIIDFNLNILLPRYTLWFMITLTSYNILEYIFDKVKAHIMIPLSIIIGILSGFIPSIGLELSLSRTCTFLPFYTIGYYSKNIDLLKLRNNKLLKYVSIFASIICIYILFNSGKKYSLNLLKGATSYYDMKSSLLVLPIRRLSSYIMSCIISIAFMMLVPKKESALTTLGQNTLYIYLTQGIILKTFITNNWMIKNKILGSILLFVITLFLTTIFSIIIPKIKQKLGGILNGRKSKSSA